MSGCGSDMRGDRMMRSNLQIAFEANGIEKK